MVREKVTAFGEPGNVPISLAQDLIKSSAFWVDHRQGIIHPEPGWADRIERGLDGWEVKFGAHYFLVESAVLHSKRVIIEELDHAQNLTMPIDQKLLYSRLITCVRKSVANWNHDPFDYYTGGTDKEVKRQGFYTEDSYTKSGLLISINRERFGFLPPSKKDAWNGFMKFGVHAIEVDAFIKRILQLADLNAVE